MFPAADPVRRVLHHCSSALPRPGREQAIAAAQPAGPEHVLPGIGRPRTTTTAASAPHDGRAADSPNQQRVKFGRHAGKLRRLTVALRALRCQVIPAIRVSPVFRIPQAVCYPHPMPHRPSTSAQGVPSHAEGKAPGSGRSKLPVGQADSLLPAHGAAPSIRALIDHGFQAFNAGRLSEACHIFADKMLAPENDTTIGLTVAGAMTPAGLGGCVIEMMERGLVDFVISTGANLYHDLHYALNFTLRRGSPFLDDRDLYERASSASTTCCSRRPCCSRPTRTSATSSCAPDMHGPISTSEFHYRLGQDLLEARSGLRRILGRRARGQARRARSTRRRPATARSA